MGSEVVSFRNFAVKCPGGRAAFLPQIPFSGTSSSQLTHREHTAAAELRSRRSQGLATPRTRLAITGKPMMHHRVLIAILHACQLFVADAYGPEHFMDEGGTQWEGLLPSKFLGRKRRLSIELCHLGVLLLVKHRDFHLASPTPEHPHYS